jgi:uncharacterized protein (TIGR02284 family)
MLLRTDEQVALNQVESLMIEAADRYDTAAARTGDAQLAQLFAGLAQRRRQLAAELAQHIRALDDLPQYPDPDRETVQDLLTGIKALFSADERKALIDERVQAEQKLAESVQGALQLAVPEQRAALLGRMLADIEAACNQLGAAH